jgi:hypothetical protein
MSPRANYADRATVTCNKYKQDFQTSRQMKEIDIDRHKSIGPY